MALMRARVQEGRSHRGAFPDSPSEVQPDVAFSDATPRHINEGRRFVRGIIRCKLAPPSVHEGGEAARRRGGGACAAGGDAAAPGGGASLRCCGLGASAALAAEREFDARCHKLAQVLPLCSGGIFGRLRKQAETWEGSGDLPPGLVSDLGVRKNITAGFRGDVGWTAGEKAATAGLLLAMDDPHLLSQVGYLAKVRRLACVACMCGMRVVRPRPASHTRPHMPSAHKHPCGASVWHACVACMCEVCSGCRLPLPALRRRFS